MVYCLDIARKAWCTDCAWAEEIVNGKDMGRRDGILTGHEFER